MKAVRSDSREVGQSINIHDMLNSWTNPRLVCTGKIVRMTKTQIVIKPDNEFEEMKFNRVTGCQVGYCYPHATRIIAPESAK